LTPEQFADQFGPSEEDYQKVANFAKVSGLQIAGTYSNRMLLDVRGKVSDIQRAFHVTLRIYRHPTENRDFFAPDTEPVINTALPILDVSGLNNYSLPRPNNYQIRPFNGVRTTTSAKPDAAVPESESAAPAAGSAPGGAYQGNDFRNAYVPGTTLTGAGQNVGLLQFDGFFTNDIANYESQIGLTSNVPRLVIVPVDGGVPAPNPSDPNIAEVSLDIEMVLSMSPGVSNIYVYEAPNPSPWVDLLNRMANDDLAKQLSCSWGGGGPDPVAEQIFEQMALQGQTFFTASGDSDAYTGSVPFPSDSPYITIVGGTTLTTGAGASYSSETVWNVGPTQDGEGSSGGISPTYSIPSWQTNINFTASHGSTTMRNLPDVALTADNVWVIHNAGQAGPFGGTSCAAPLWAGFTALINQQASNKSLPSVGFLNPALYAIASGTNYNNCFHDTTTGSNEWSGSPNLFNAVTNYDLCTGLGAPKGTNLINALATTGTNNTISHISAPPPAYGSTLSALNGGNPNGTWELFVQDDSLYDSGIISNGWSITLTTANPVGFVADNALSMIASATNVVYGTSINFYLSVTNYGPSISSNVLVSDTLPSGFILTSTNATQGSVTRSGLVVLWNIGTLAVNAGAQLHLTVEADNFGNNLDYASVSAGTSDQNPADDAVFITVNVTNATPPQIAGNFISANGTFKLTISNPTNPAVSTIIQASTNLINWVNIYTNTPPFTFTDPNASNYPYRFYRAVAVP
jgi:uncharacterized repeat protein (TIGR01451 family)